MSIPKLQDILQAQKRIRPYLARTPLHSYPAINELVGTTLFIKHENYQPIGAFKVRGGINLVSQMGPEERQRGIISASTGNHGQSVAYAARLFGVKARIVVPEKANPGKVAAMQGMGAEVIAWGANFDEAREHSEALAQEHGYRYIHSGNEPHLIAGVATEALEIMEQQPDIEVIIVPVGGGSGASGTCIAAKAINSKVQVIGVQSAEAPAAYRSWKERRLVTDRMGTIAEGMATRTAFELPQRMLREKLDDFVLVPDAELRTAVRLMIETTRNLAEPAGAAALAAALRLKDRLRGRRVALILSGANITPSQLREFLG